MARSRTRALKRERLASEPPALAIKARAPGRLTARRRRAIAGLSSLLVYTVLAFALFSSAWRDPTHRYVGAGADPELFTWLLGWTPFAITHGHNPFLTDYLNYPAGANLMWSGAFTAPGLLAWPAWAAFGPAVAFDLVVTMAVALSAWAAYLALAKLVRSRLAAAVGGLLYGFSPYVLAHSLGHANFVIAVFPPVALWLLHELFVRRSWPPWAAGGLLGAAAAAQLVTGEEILATTVVVSAVGALWLALLNPSRIRSHLPRGAMGLAAAGVVGGALAAYPLYVQFFGPQRVFTAIRPPDFYVNDLLTFFVPTYVFLLAPQAALSLAARWTGNPSEWNGYIGIPLAILLLGIAVRGWRSPLVRWTALMGVTVALLSMGPHLHLDGKIRYRVPLPWNLVQDLPLLRDVLPSRLSIYFFLVAAGMVAWFVDRLRDATGWRRAAGWAVLAIALIPLLPHLPWYTSEHPMPAFFQGAAATAIPDGSVALVAPFSIEGGSSDPQLWQARADYRFRMPNGYVLVPASSDGPQVSTTREVMQRVETGRPPPELTPELEQAMSGELVRWHVRTVIVGPMRNEDAEVRLFTQLLGREPERVGGVWIWRNVQIRQ